MNLLLTHSPFLQSQAQLLALPVSTDGHILHPVVARCQKLFADNYDHYQQKTMAGELSLGDVLVHRLNKQLAGLGVQSGRAVYVANMLTHKFPEQPISVRTLTLCLKNFKPQLYELMRYQGIRRVALLGSALLVKSDGVDGEVVQFLTAERIVEVCCEVLGDVPKITIEVHFAKDTPLPQKTLENPS